MQWHLIVIVGQPVIPRRMPVSPGRHRGSRSTSANGAGLDKVEAEETSPATDLNFDPLVLPVGIEPSDDPLLNACSAVYSQSFTRRSGEASRIPPSHRRTCLVTQIRSESKHVASAPTVLGLSACCIGAWPR